MFFSCRLKADVVNGSKNIELEAKQGKAMHNKKVYKKNNKLL